MANAPFDPGVVRASLKPLVPGAPAVLTAAEDAYLRHYGIHFSESIDGLAHQLGRIDTDTHTLSAHLWTPREARGSAVVIHGYYDHVGLYGHLIRYLLDRDMTVLSFDLPGHGLSSGAPATIETFDHYVAAFEACFRACERHLPTPRRLIGQSTGGAIAMEWLLANGVTRESSPFDRIVLLAPLVRPYGWGYARIAYQIAKRLVTERPRGLSDNADNEEFLDFLRHRDPLQAKTLPVQWVTAMVEWMRRFEARPPSDLSLLVLQGSADKTVDWRYNVKVIERLFLPEIVYLPEARHHLVNESPALRARMFSEIDRFLA